MDFERRREYEIIFFMLEKQEAFAVAKASWLG